MMLTYWNIFPTLQTKAKKKSTNLHYKLVRKNDQISPLIPLNIYFEVQIWNSTLVALAVTEHCQVYTIYLTAQLKNLFFALISSVAACKL